LISLDVAHAGHLEQYQRLRARGNIPTHKPLENKAMRHVPRAGAGGNFAGKQADTGRSIAMLSVSFGKQEVGHNG
jgi:hypothetical protein